MRNWTEEQIDFLRQHLAFNTKEIYALYQEEFGSGHRSYDSVQKKIKAMREAFDPEEIDQDEEEEVNSRLAELLGEESHLYIPTVTSKMKSILTMRTKAWLEGMIETSKKLDFPPPRAAVSGQESTLCIALSDLHYGQQTRWYDMAEAHARTLSMATELFQRMKAQKIDEIVVLIVGDTVEGEDIYPTQASHVLCSTIDQVMTCSESLWELLVMLRKLFKVPVRVVAVPGNHGRAGKTVSEKTNWDNVVYHSLRLLMRHYKDSDLSLECDFKEFRTFEVKDRRGLVHHEGVKHSGTPAMQIKIAGWMSAFQCDFMVHGHFHEWKVGDWNGKIIVSNGSMCGPNDLSDRLAKDTPARQGYWLVTPGMPLHSFGFIEWKVDDEVSHDDKEQQ